MFSWSRYWNEPWPRSITTSETSNYHVGRRDDNCDGNESKKPAETSWQMPGVPWKFREGWRRVIDAGCRKVRVERRGGGWLEWKDDETGTGQHIIRGEKSIKRQKSHEIHRKWNELSNKIFLSNHFVNHKTIVVNCEPNRKQKWFLSIIPNNNYSTYLFKSRKTKNLIECTWISWKNLFLYSK